MRTVHDFARKHAIGHKISMVTCYDFTFAQLLNSTAIDSILVGDSLSMVIYGHPNTLTATPDLMAQHIAAVARGAPDKFIVGDMPFGSYRSGLANTMAAVASLMRAGAHAVKIEGAGDNIKTIKHIIASGVPVMGHLGLTPQACNALGGFKVQGKNLEQAQQIKQDALALASAGCFALVLECIPAILAAEITASIAIPTIGIGAGAATSGQILVLYDLLGLGMPPYPKFVKTFGEGATLVQNALDDYVAAVESVTYPDPLEHSY